MFVNVVLAVEVVWVHFLVVDSFYLDRSVEKSIFATAKISPHSFCSSEDVLCLGFAGVPCEGQEESRVVENLFVRRASWIPAHQHTGTLFAL